MVIYIICIYDVVCVMRMKCAVFSNFWLGDVWN